MNPCRNRSSPCRVDSATLRRKRLLYLAVRPASSHWTDLRGVPLVRRKDALKALLADFAADARVRSSEHDTRQGAELFHHACRLRLEGTCPNGAMHHTDPAVRRLAEDRVHASAGVRDRRLATLDGAASWVQFGWYFDDGELHDAGKVAAGFGARERGQLIRRLWKHERKQSPFTEVPRADARDARWAEPVTVAEVEFTDWTRDRRVRHPSLKGIREDKEPREVTMETSGEQVCPRGIRSRWCPPVPTGSVSPCRPRRGHEVPAA
jgi:bifunctional non-homologous end joining protein LigD